MLPTALPVCPTCEACRQIWEDLPEISSPPERPPVTLQADNAWKCQFHIGRKGDETFHIVLQPAVYFSYTCIINLRHEFTCMYSYVHIILYKYNTITQFII